MFFTFSFTQRRKKSFLEHLSDREIVLFKFRKFYVPYCFLWSIFVRLHQHMQVTEFIFQTGKLFFSDQQGY